MKNKHEMDSCSKCYKAIFLEDIWYCGPAVEEERICFCHVCFLQACQKHFGDALMGAGDIVSGKKLFKGK